MMVLGAFLGDDDGTFGASVDVSVWLGVGSKVDSCRSGIQDSNVDYRYIGTM